MILSCKGILELSGSLLSGNIIENTITGNMERDVCCCYRKTGLVSKGFLESRENTIPAIRGPASDLYLRQFCTLECLRYIFCDSFWGLGPTGSKSAIQVMQLSSDPSVSFSGSHETELPE